MRNKEKGFSLIELLLVVVVFSFVAVLIASFMNTRSRSIELLNVNKAASDSLENALKVLTRVPYNDLPVGGSFTDSSDGSVILTDCSAQSCDYVFDNTGGSSDVPLEISLAGGVKWGSGVPSDTQPLFFRRWRIENLDENLRLKRVTLAVFLDDQSTHPLVITTTLVGEK